MAGVYTPVTPAYKLIFDEEFNGIKLDTKKWNFNWFAAQPAMPGQIINDQFALKEDAAYSTSQIAVVGGHLNIALIAKPTTVSNEYGTATHPYLSGMVHTRGKFTMTFGYVEARMFNPQAKGGPAGQMPNWPAFWMVNSSGAYEELDAIEGLSGYPQIHYHDDAGAYPGGAASEVPGNYTGWHVYGMLFSQTGVTFFYDGKSVGIVDRKLPGSPLYFDLAQAAEEGVGGPNAPATIMFDYVHAYSLEGKAVTPEANYGGPGDTGSDPTATPVSTPTEEIKK